MLGWKAPLRPCWGSSRPCVASCAASTDPGIKFDLASTPLAVPNILRTPAQTWLGPAQHLRSPQRVFSQSEQARWMVPPAVQNHTIRPSSRSFTHTSGAAVQEKDEYVESILADVARLGVQYERLSYTSDYFPQMQDCADKLIQAGTLYADDTPQEQMRSVRPASWHLTAGSGKFRGAGISCNPKSGLG